MATPQHKDVEQLKSLLHDQPENPMRPNVLEGHQEEMNRLVDLVKAPAYVQADRGFAQRRLRSLQTIVNTQAAKKIAEPIRQDAVNTLARSVLEHVIKPAMLSHEEMRRTPVGAVDGFLRRENSPAIKDAVMTWKRAMRALEPENTDVDYTNMERFRRSQAPEGAASFMATAQIPGNFAMTPQAKEQWPLGEPVAETALKQVQRAEIARNAVKIRWEKRNAKLAAKARKAALATPAPPLAAEG